MSSADDTVDQRLAELDQQFKDGETSYAEYASAQEDLLNQAIEEGEDPSVQPDLPNVVHPERIAVIRQRIEEKKQAECDQWTVICPDELLAKLARAGDLFSVAGAAEFYSDGWFSPSFTDNIDHPTSYWELASRGRKQALTNFAAYTGVALLVAGGVVAAEAGPVVALGTALETGAPAAGGAASTTGLVSTAAVPALVTEAPAAAATGGALLARLAAVPGARPIFAASLGGALGLEGVGGIFGALGSGNATTYVAGACLVAVAARGCLPSSRGLFDADRPGSSARRSPLRPGEIDVEIGGQSATDFPLTVRLTIDRYEALMRAVEPEARMHRGAAGLRATTDEAHNQLAVAAVLSARYPKMAPENVARVAWQLTPRRRTGLPADATALLDTHGYFLARTVARDNPALIAQLRELGLIRRDVTDIVP